MIVERKKYINILFLGIFLMLDNGGILLFLTLTGVGGGGDGRVGRGWGFSSTGHLLLLFGGAIGGGEGVVVGGPMQELGERSCKARDRTFGGERRHRNRGRWRGPGSIDLETLIRGVERGREGLVGLFI